MTKGSLLDDPYKLAPRQSKPTSPFLKRKHWNLKQTKNSVWFRNNRRKCGKVGTADPRIPTQIWTQGLSSCLSPSPCSPTIPMGALGSSHTELGTVNYPLVLCAVSASSPACSALTHCTHFCQRPAHWAAFLVYLSVSPFRLNLLFLYPERLTSRNFNKSLKIGAGLVEQIGIVEGTREKDECSPKEERPVFAACSGLLDLKLYSCPWSYIWGPGLCELAWGPKLHLDSKSLEPHFCASKFQWTYSDFFLPQPSVSVM